MASSSRSSQPKVIVGLDFGTTFSGFSFAHRSDPDDVQSFYDWPDAGRPYCKTQTSLFYSPAGELLAWGWSALKAYSEALQVSSSTGQGEVGLLVSKFKPILEDGELAKSMLEVLPGWATAEKLIVDYLGCISEFIGGHLRQKYGSCLLREEVAWCLSVPAIWSDASKRKMEIYAENAGIVKGKHCSSSEASSFPLKIVLEPEAASFYCQKQLKDTAILCNGDKFLTVDVGGGTIDLVVHEKVEGGSSYEVREVSASSGELGGGTYVDKNFLGLLKRKIGCLESFDDPETLHKITRWWLGSLGKSSFDGTGFKLYELPRKLSKAWKKFDEQLGCAEGHDEEYYEKIKLSEEELRGIFDTEIEKVAALIDKQLSHCRDTMIQHVFLVGGFAESPYLVKKITEKYNSSNAGATREVIAPPSPGAAICKGAVALGFGTAAVVSRISKKWYGLRTAQRFQEGDREEYKFVNDEGVDMCDEKFQIFVKNGESIAEDTFVSDGNFGPSFAKQRSMTIELFSSSGEIAPSYVTDPGCKRLGKYIFDISENMELGHKRSVFVSMYFGRSSIQVFAQRINFGKNRQPEKLYCVDLSGSSIGRKRKSRI
ncbi:hypothetical protein SELMODRAFT_411756 [Selaginella moellendorffii]|uniref:Uncharacterized protein n=1 Tax=Selaginella moellendorffii TaxID=88036 RepID=D8RIY4_SELML|nr:heat shock 70 kDa protein 12A [Selaginella moellendorffii]EFJ27612.1 hypothetical protein SELMODRAFT_411756 [Selaginella moellendorffii]|eukprot:XP_002971014.1 heat shock 70 kDa protein 12A [Selaginella moellendorffii]